VDITERERLNQELLYLAHHDALTSLPNRLTLDDRIQQCIARSVREERKAVLLTIDVDRFKLINDTYGHLIGDECLKEVARRLQTRIRRVDTVARTGGEEFTAIIGGLKQVEDAALVASTLRELFDTPMLLGGNQVKLTISIGAAIYPDDGEEPEVLRRRSDQALYHAKRTGRNKVVFASPEVSEAFEQTAGDYGTLPFVATEDGMGSQRGRETVS
jgi:diguanylate cyclase (GGDEF)-like protein